MAVSASLGGKVQHVTKASSDELLRKFAEEEPGEKFSIRKNHPLLRVSLARRKRKPSRRAICRPAMACYIHGGDLITERTSEWKGLLQHSPLPRRSSALRQIVLASGISEKIRASDVFLHALEKTWRKMIEGASKMAAEGHCNQHVRLIGDTS